MAAKTKDANSDPQATRSPAEIQALKDDLFRRAATGEITGEEADAEAERLGIGRLVVEARSCRLRPGTAGPLDPANDSRLDRIPEGGRDPRRLGGILC